MGYFNGANFVSRQQPSQRTFEVRPTRAFCPRRRRRAAKETEYRAIGPASFLGGPPEVKRGYKARDRDFEIVRKSKLGGQHLRIVTGGGRLARASAETTRRGAAGRSEGFLAARLRCLEGHWDMLSSLSRCRLCFSHLQVHDGFLGTVNAVEQLLLQPFSTSVKTPSTRR